MSQEAEKTTRKRPPFSKEEDETLLEEYFKRRKTIESKHDKAVTTKTKRQAWSEITAAVDSVVSFFYLLRNNLSL